MHHSPRRIVGALGALLLSSTLLIAPTATGTEDFTLTRVAGTDRYATAAQAALDAFPSADAAVIARGDAFPDALAGSYLAGALGAPVLLTTPSALPDATSSALDDLGVSTVYLLGGSAAISEAVAAEAEGDGDTPRTVERVAGGNRYATAAQIATSQAAESIGEVDGKRTAILASGAVFADALASGPVAFSEGLPILLTPPTSLAPEAQGAIEDLGIEHLLVAGGTAAVSDAVVTAAKSGGATSERLAGPNRYATASAIADFALADLGFDDASVDLATGERFADALAAGPAAGVANRPLLLTATASLSAEARDWLVANAGTLMDGRVFGGTAAVTDAVVTAAEAAGSGADTGPATGQLTFVDKAIDTYRFVPDGASTSRTVTYKSTDTFTVDGATATVGGFETAVTPGDQVRHVPASGTTAARHELTNVAASSITEGTVGNVDIENDNLDLVHPVNGDAIRIDLDYAGLLYEVDGAPVTEAGFEGAVNEGDELAITGSAATLTYELTNVDVTGVAGSVVVSPLPPATDLKIGALGDDPESDADETYQANGEPGATDTFTVDGQTAEYGDFADAITAGDAVTYSREGEGVEHFALVNRAPSTIEGQGVDDLDPDGDPSPVADGGGTFTIVTNDGPEAVEYAAGGAFIVDGAVSDESEFEAAYSAGDLVSFRAADTPSGTSQRIELTNRTLQGPVDPESINTGDDPVLPGTGPGPNSYGVLGPDSETVVRQVTYVGETESANTYFVNGAAVTLAAFETALDAIAGGTKAGTMVVQVTGTGDSAVTQHRLTTTEA